MSGSPDLTMAAVKMIAALIAVLGLLWGLSRLARRNLAFGRGPGGQGLIRILESRHLGVKKSIAVVQVHDALLVLGISADRVNLLSRLDSEIPVPAASQEISPGQPTGFREYLQRLTGMKSK